MAPNNTVAGLAEKLRAMLDDVDAVKLRPEGFVQGVRALLALASPAPSAGWRAWWRKCGSVRE